MARPAPLTARAGVATGRVAGLDALRGGALCAMIVYHFCFDLRHYGVLRADFEHDALWLAARTAILSSFLLLAGVSLVLADRARRPGAAFWRHVGTIAGCALVVSAASYAIFPQSYIWFGVLHAIAVSLVLARPLRGSAALALAAGLVVVVAGIAVASPAFDSRALGWLGFMTAKPQTEDYVPLFPWAGVLFVGVAAGHALSRSDFRILAPLARPPRWLAWLGRHSLLVYMVHQPLLLGALWLALRG
jgi:uncharacterized membrane protein